MKKALITGSGMLATALARAAQRYGWAATLLPHADLDIGDAEAVLAAVAGSQPELVLHTAALTKVDYCESHQDEAEAVNHLGAANVARAAERAMARLVYFSTDYVFNGGTQAKLTEDDQPDPVNAYGRSKLAGEIAVLERASSAVVRTSGVFGERGDAQPERNFFKAIASLLRENDRPVEVINNQFTAVTYASHLASMVYELLGGGMPRIVHLTSAGEDSWYGWAVRMARQLGCEYGRIAPVETTMVSRAALRPVYSVLSSKHANVRELVARHVADEGIADYAKTLVAGLSA